MYKKRQPVLEIEKKEFRKIGYQLIDKISDYLESIHDIPVTPGETPEQLNKLLGDRSLPVEGRQPAELISEASELLFNHSLFNGHPKFFGYITSSAAPIGALADLLAAAVNPNVGANILSPMATEIEKQTIRWLAEFIGLSGWGGILVSGGNMANFTGFLAGRTVKAPANFKKDGIAGLSKKLIVYCSSATHTWIDKASVLSGLGSDAVRWIQTDSNNRMNNSQLLETIRSDISKDYQPIMVIGTAGDVSTGAVDDLKSIAEICKKFDLWFHVDGAYGIPAAVVPEYKRQFEGMEEADSIALDPHKWLYSPIEAGCTLVRDPEHLRRTFGSEPDYYHFNKTNETSTNFFEYGLQNSRGFRALKVWMAIQQAGKTGYVNLISEDIRLSKLMFEKAKVHPELEAISQNLSITTFRYIPAGLVENSMDNTYLNKLNEALLNVLEKNGEIFLSNAVIRGKYCLRACIVNFRTSEKDIEETINIIVQEGRKLYNQSDMQNIE